MINGVVRRGDGAVAAGIQRFELKVDVNFFAGLNRRKNRPSVFLFKFAAVKVDAILRVDPVAMLLQQPIHAIRRAALLVCR